MATEQKDKEVVGDSNCGPCPKCGSKDVNASDIKDVAFSIHYIDDEAGFTCNTCGHTWRDQCGYRGLA
jgi:transposase-like protein